MCKECSCFGQILHQTNESFEPVILEKKDDYEIIENYGEIIKNAREKKNLTRQELAAKIKIKENILRRVEGGRLVPEKDVARRIEKELEIKLLEKIDKKFPKKEFKKVELTIGDVVKID